MNLVPAPLLITPTCVLQEKPPTIQRIIMSSAPLVSQVPEIVCSEHRSPYRLSKKWFLKTPAALFPTTEVTEGTSR